MAFYVTTPIYYPNGEPHLGSVYTTTLCDVLARYHRLCGEPTFFLTGTDEHGTKMEKAAADAGVAPIDLATKYAEQFRSTWAELKISNDDFIRTTEPRHKSAVSEIVTRLVASDDIYLGAYEGWYDEGQEEFVTETEAKINEYQSKISRKPLTRWSEPSYFFRLSKYVPAIIEYIGSHPHFIVPASRRNEVLSKLRAGVDDLSISRATLKWGIPLPHDPDHVVYVWIDALTNYVTALDFPNPSAPLSEPSGSAAGTNGRDSRFSTFWPADVHVIGKDILWFHCVYWPAMLMALKLPLPKTIAGHGWWVRGGMKAGKSTGGLTTLNELRVIVSIYSLDALRYHLVRAAPFGNDLEWSQEELDRSYNELANVVGNCLNRVLNMTHKYFEGRVPELPPASTPPPFKQSIEGLAGQLAAAYADINLQQCALLPVELARQINGYIDATAPFKLAKSTSPTDQNQLRQVMHYCIQGIRSVLIALLPILPEKAAAGLSQMGIESSGRAFGELLASDLPSGFLLGKGTPLFPRIESSKPADG